MDPLVLLTTGLLFSPVRIGLTYEPEKTKFGYSCLAFSGPVYQHAMPAEYVPNGSSPSIAKPSDVYSPSEITTLPPGPSVTSTSIGATMA